MTQSPHRVQRILQNRVQFWKARLPPQTTHFEILVRDLTRSAPRRLKTGETRVTWKCPVCLTIKKHKDSGKKKVKKGSSILYPRGREEKRGMIEREQTDSAPTTPPAKNPNELNKIIRSNYGF